MRLQSASRCGDYHLLSNGNSHHRKRRGYIDAEEVIAFANVIARQLVAFVLCLFTGGGKQVDVASNVAAVIEVWLERFYRNLTYVDVYRQEDNGVVLGVECF